MTDPDTIDEALNELEHWLVAALAEVQDRRNAGVCPDTGKPSPGNFHPDCHPTQCTVAEGRMYAPLVKPHPCPEGCECDTPVGRPFAEVFMQHLRDEGECETCGGAGEWFDDGGWLYTCSDCPAGEAV